jgi:hypothetical protein
LQGGDLQLDVGSQWNVGHNNALNDFFKPRDVDPDCESSWPQIIERKSTILTGHTLSEFLTITLQGDYGIGDYPPRGVRYVSLNTAGDNWRRLRKKA